MSTTLVTGADGHIGSAVAQRLLATSDRKLLLLVRSAKPLGQNPVFDALSGSARCRVVVADLTEEQALANVETASISEILHCAAVTDFNVSRDLAEAVNVDGTKRLVAFAERCASLRCFGLTSSLYSSGLVDGEQSERLWTAEPAFANHYEWSKWQSERIVAGSGLPWQIYRLSTILADDADGRVTQQNVIHNTLRLMFYGLMPVMPGYPDTRVYTVTTDFVASSLARLLLQGAAESVSHVTESGESAPPLGTLADIVYEAFLEDDGFRTAAILKPRFCDQDTFTALQASAEQFATPSSDALASVAPFVPQLFSDKDFRTEATTSALQGAAPPGGAALLASVARAFAADRWGARSQGDKQHA